MVLIAVLCRINATVIGSKNAPESAADEGGAADEAEEKVDEAEGKADEEAEEKAEEAEA